MTKEMLVYAKTKDGALVKLLADFSDYRRLHSITSWRWIKPPEVKNGKISGEWHAYGRIEYQK